METLKKKKNGDQIPIADSPQVHISQHHQGWLGMRGENSRAFMGIYKSIYTGYIIPTATASSFHTPSPSLPNPTSSFYNQQSKHPPHIILGGKMIIDSQGIIVRENSKSFGSLNNFKIFWFCAPHVLGSFLSQTRELDYLTMFDLVETVMISVSAAILTDQYCQ